MNESYLNSVRNTVLSSKPSTTIHLLLMVLFVFRTAMFNNKISLPNSMKRHLFSIFLCLFFVNVGFCATIKFIGASTNAASKDWNTASNWSPNTVPTDTDDVVIPNGKIVIVTTTPVFAKSISVTGNGELTVNNNKTLTVFGNVDVANGAKFNAGTGNSDSATILVYGNFTNQGTANFWKSTVVIKGNLVTSNTILQNNGNILVGGNVSGVIGGSGSGTVYPVNPNATVNVTGDATELPAGTQPTDSVLVALMNSVIYGGACSPSITISSINASDACKSDNQSTVTITSTSTSMLPVGTYTVIYDLYGNNNNLTASMRVNSAGTGVFVANVSAVGETATGYIRIKKIASSVCYSDLNSNSNNFYMHPLLTAPTAKSGYYECDRKWIAQWDQVSSVDGYYLDVATDINFTNFFIKDKYLAGIGTQSDVIANLAYGGIYYYRVRAKSFCGISAYSNTITINIIGYGSTPGTITGGATSICIGNTTTFVKDINTWPSTGTWSVFNQTGSASITQSGDVTGVSPGTVLVVFTTQNGGCGTSTSKPLTITGGTVSAASSTPTVCTNTAITPITHTTTGFTGISNNGVSGVNGLPAGVSASFAPNVVTISGEPTVSGTFTYSIPLTGGSCSVVANATGTITVNPLPITPTVTLTQPNCTVSTGTITVPATGVTYTVTGTNPVVAAKANATGVFSGLASGTYTVSATNGCGTSPEVTVIISSSTKTWKGTAWLPDGIAPTKDDVVIINGNYNTSSNGDLNACSLTINSGYTLTVTAGKFVVIQNDLTVDGTLDVLDKGSLVMVNDAGKVAGTGTTRIHKFTTETKKFDFVYWSTPVASTTIATTFLGWRNDRAYEYDKGWKFATAMTPAKGFIITVPNPIVTSPPTPNISEVVFQGQVNNGVKKIENIAPSAPYLIGNPYPSAIDADAFLNENAKAIGGTIYFWTHNTAIQLASNITNGTAGSGAYAFTSDDYATYNIVGGVATGSLPAGGNLPNSNSTIPTTLKPTGQIASCQGFFATSNAAGQLKSTEIVFKNAMRLGSGDKSLDNTNFFRTKASKTAKTFEKNRLWLNLTNTGGAFKQLLVGYVTDATNDYDSRFDGETFSGNQFIDFYSVVQDKNLTIQGRALPFDEKDEVPLGYNTTIEGAFTISLDEADGFMSNQSVFLEDKLTNTVFDLKAGNYTFNTAKGTFNDRFVLKYANKTLGMEDVVEKEDGILALYSNNYQTLIIHNKGISSTVNSVALFNMTGQEIGVWNVKDFEQTNIQIPIKDISSGIYIVKISTTNGDSSKKIVVN
jgi:hypothetical protein